jgi:hypothetical protein
VRFRYCARIPANQGSPRPEEEIGGALQLKKWIGDVHTHGPFGLVLLVSLMRCALISYSACSKAGDQKPSAAAADFRQSI